MTVIKDLHGEGGWVIDVDLKPGAVAYDGLHHISQFTASRVVVASEHGHRFVVDISTGAVTFVRSEEPA